MQRAALAGLAASLALAAPARVALGPGGCVSLSRSPAGACVISTDCDGRDLATFEFVFDCESADGAVRHSFGRGGFGPREDYDTGVKCTRCAAPAPPRRQLLLAREPPKHRWLWPYKPRGKEPPAPVVRYGPQGCVSTYRSPEGHCIMKTLCTAKDVRNYSFGLVCVDQIGAPVRHLFGKGSFDPVETFDTLIPCNQCLGLEDIPDGVALNSQVLALSQEVQSLEKLVTSLSGEVEKLSRAPAPMAPTTAAPAASTRAPVPAMGSPEPRPHVPPLAAPAATPVLAPAATPAAQATMAAPAPAPAPAAARAAQARFLLSAGPRARRGADLAAEEGPVPVEEPVGVAAGTGEEESEEAEATEGPEEAEQEPEAEEPAGPESEAEDLGLEAEVPEAAED